MWIKVTERLPTKAGWYKVKTTNGETEIPFVNNARKQLVWVVPDELAILEWLDEEIKAKVISINREDRTDIYNKILNRKME